jgi:hypothetical protein
MMEAGQGDDLNVRVPLADLVRRLGPVHVGHDHVHQDHIRQ